MSQQLFYFLSRYSRTAEQCPSHTSILLSNVPYSFLHLCDICSTIISASKPHAEGLFKVDL